MVRSNVTRRRKLGSLGAAVGTASAIASGSRPAPKALPPTVFSDPKDVAWVLSKVTPQPIGTFLQPVKLSGARERVVKKTYIRLPKFQLAALDKAAEECKSDKFWTVLENTTSGHSITISQPDWLTDVLLKAA